MIKAEKILKKFKNGDSELVVLKGLDFQVKKGEFVSIIGRSGSGKSTLLYQLGLLDTPNEGKIQIDGVDVIKLTSDEKTRFRLEELGFVFQDYALIPELTAMENVMIPLLMQGLSEEEAKIKAKKAMMRVGLSDKLESLPNKLSGGQQQRVSIARAISHEPKIIFADEPTANLDNETADAVIETFVELNKQGQTIVMVTHEKEYAERTHRVVVLSDGKVQEDKGSETRYLN